MKKPRITFLCDLEASVLQALFTLPDLVTLGELNAGISLFGSTRPSRRTARRSLLSPAPDFPSSHP